MSLGASEAVSVDVDSGEALSANADSPKDCIADHSQNVDEGTMTTPTLPTLSFQDEPIDDGTMTDLHPDESNSPGPPRATYPDGRLRTFSGSSGGSSKGDRGRGLGRGTSIKMTSNNPGGAGEADVPTVHVTLAKKQKKIGHRKVKMGMVIYKGHPSWNLMLNIQLGIRSSVGRITPEPERELWKDDFRVKVKQNFPREGTSMTPAHDAADFKFADYAPFAFRHLREKFQIDAADYMLSICGNDALRELSSPGKSGALFYITNDDKYIIKTVSKKECHFLRAILQDYYMHIMQTPDTLLPRFFGLVRVKTQKGRNIRLVIMNNILPSKYHFHERYDLKGSTFGRAASQKELKSDHCIKKDLDWNLQFELSEALSTAIKRQIASDARFLQNLHIMDYSLLVGVHYKHVDEDHPNYDSDEDDLRGSRPYRSVFQKQDGGVDVRVKDSENVARLFFGIIDILQVYEVRKKTEHLYKSFVYDAKTISVVQPSFYARRFNDFIVRCLCET